MKKLVVLLLVLVLLAGATGVFAGGRGEQAETDTEGRLVVYSPLHEYEISRILTQFERDTGIRTEFIRLSAGEMAARIVAERNNPQGDVFFGGPSETHEAIIPDGVLRPYESPRSAETDSSFRHADFYWSGFYVGPMGFAINTSRWQDVMGDAAHPRTWEDLLDPRLEGEIIMASPAASGTAYNIVATQFFRYASEDEAWDYLARLDENVPFYTSSGAAPARQAGTGEAIVGIAFAHDVMKPIDAGFPLALSIPQESGWEIGAVSIINEGPNPRAAEAFVDWILGPDAQQLHTDLSLRISTHPEVQLPPGSTPLSELSLVDYDNEWAGENRARIVDQWSELFN